MPKGLNTLLAFSIYKNKFAIISIILYIYYFLVYNTQKKKKIKSRTEEKCISIKEHYI